MSYTILDHPADVKLRTTGATLEGAFSAIVHALADVVDAEELLELSDEPGTSHEIRIRSESLEALLFDYLNRLILLQDLEDVVAVDVDDLTIDEDGGGYTLSTTVLTEAIPPDGALLDIKAPTYSEMRIESNDRWIVEAVLDV